jgi:hypothetical protein
MTNQDEAERRRQDLIQRRAYEIFQARGGREDLEVEDWLQAEREVDGRLPDEDELPAPEEEEEPR